MKKKYTYLEIGNRLKGLRKKTDLSQKEFASEINTPLVTYQRYESGERMPPEIVLKRVAELCGKTVDWLLGRDLASVIAEEREKHEAEKAELEGLENKLREKLLEWGIPIPKNTSAFLEVVTFYNKQGIHIVDLIKGQLSPEKQGEIIKYEGPERRKHWPYTTEEQLYHDKLQEILKGKNKKNARAIKENIDAFYETRDVEIPLEVKKAEGA